MRDYILTDQERVAVTWLGSSSPFNVTAEATTIAAFSGPEVAELVEQHTAKTGQRFDPSAITRIFELSAGHPWLVNALADQAVR